MSRQRGPLAGARKGRRFDPPWPQVVVAPQVPLRPTRPRVRVDFVPRKIRRTAVVPAPVQQSVWIPPRLGHRYLPPSKSTRTRRTFAVPPAPVTASTWVPVRRRPRVTEVLWRRARQFTIVPQRAFLDIQPLAIDSQSVIETVDASNILAAVNCTSDVLNQPHGNSVVVNQPNSSSTISTVNSAATVVTYNASGDTRGS